MIYRKLHPDCIKEIKERTDIVDVISGFAELRKRGKNYLGLCPFHDEKTPSFSISPTKGLAYCFGCGWGGDAVKFLMELNRVSFVDAVLDLARSANILVRYEDGSTEYDYPDPLPRPLTPKPLPTKEEKENSESKDYTVDEWRVNRSVERLLSGTGDAAKALGWLGQRGISREMVKRYRLGLEKRLVTPDKSDPERKEAYWAIAIFIPVPKRPGRFYVKKRVAPWLSDDERPSYLGKWAQFGVPATIWFTYNPDNAQETYYVEGEWDALRLAEEARLNGAKVAIACSTSGAGTVPKEEELKRLPGQVTTFYDWDKAGEEGSRKLVEALPGRGKIALVPMPDNCQVKGWDVSNALDAGYTWEDFKSTASLASNYTPSIQELGDCQDHPISRDQWELTFGFGRRLRKRVKRSLEGFKGFGKPIKPEPKEAPDQLFQDANRRLQIWQDAAARGYRYILDNSAPGLGKSHSAGVALPDAFGTQKLWYLARDHRNPTTGVIESNYVDLPIRHNGLKIVDTRKTPNGNSLLIHPKEGEEPDTRANCYRTPLFRAFAAKRYRHQESAKSSDICKTCKVAYLCQQGSGVKYGATFRGERASALSSDRIRAHADSLPSIDEFDYSTSGLFWDEAGTHFEPMDEIPVSLEEFDRTWAELESIAPNLHEQFKALRLALRPFLTGELKQPYHGWDDAALRARLPEKPDNLSEVITSLDTLLQPDLSFLEQKAEFFGAADAKRLNISRGMKTLINQKFRRQADEEFQKAFNRLPLNWLTPFLKVWNGERGALRSEQRTLTVFVRNDRHAMVARTAKFNIFLDATTTKKQLALLLEIDPEEIYVVGQETPNHGNLKIVQITEMGKLGKDRSESLKRRVAAIRRALEERYPGIVFGDWKAHTEAGDGQWFVNLRGSNEFQDAPVMAVFGIPYQNLGYLQALYQTLTGEFAPLDRESPHEGLQRFIEAHTEAEIEQAVGRLRSHLRPDEELTFIFVGDYDLGFLEGEVDQIEAFQITPEAGTPAQITRWKILEAVRHLQGQGEKVTQQALASLAEISQPAIAKIAANFGGWKHLKKILLTLLDPLYSGSNNFDSLTDDDKWLAKSYLPLLLDEPPEDAVQEVGTVVQSCGMSMFLRILNAATLPTQARLLALVIQALPVNLQSELMGLFQDDG